MLGPDGPQDGAPPCVGGVSELIVFLSQFLYQKS